MRDTIVAQAAPDGPAARWRCAASRRGPRKNHWQRPPIARRIFIEPNAERRNRMRAIAFSLLKPFYFIKAGLLVSLPAIVAGAGLITVLLLIKVGAKTVGVWPVSRLSGLGIREANYTTLPMATGLTFGRSRPSSCCATG